MKNILILLLAVVYAPSIVAQDTSKTVLKQATLIDKTDNYTIQRLIVFNNKNEILMEHGRSGWMTPALRSNLEQSLKEGLDSLSALIGISISPVKLAGIFTYKYQNLLDHKGMSYRTHYTAKYKSGALIQPKLTGREYRWLPIKEALDRIGFEPLKRETAQMIRFPKVIWGGAFLLSYKEGNLESMKIIEDFYALSGK